MGTLRSTIPPGLFASTVSNSDGTLTISPTSGAVVASLNLAHANSWTALQTFKSIDVNGTSTNLQQWGYTGEEGYELYVKRPTAYAMEIGRNTYGDKITFTAGQISITTSLIFAIGADWAFTPGRSIYAQAGTNGDLTVKQDGTGLLNLGSSTGKTVMSGQVGIGVTPGLPVVSGQLHVKAPSATIYGIFDAVSTGYAYHTYQFNGAVIGYLGQGNGLVTGGSATDFGWRSENDLVFAAGGAAEAARITATGSNLKVAGNITATAYGSYPIMMGVSPDLVGQPYRGLWVAQASPDTTNYSFLADTLTTLFNAPTKIEFRNRNTTGFILTETSVGSTVPRSVFTYLADATKGDVTATVSIIPSNGTSYKGLVIQQNTSQAQPLLELQDTSGMALAAFDANGQLTIPDDAYASGWNGSVQVPTKNAVYDKIESMGAGAAIVTLGSVAFDYGSTTAVQIGTTRNNGKKFIPLYVTFDVEAASAPTGVGLATLGVGVTSPNYNETMFTFLDASFNAAGVFYNKYLPASATAQAYYVANTAVYAKMSTAITGGTMTGRISITGVEY